MKTVDARGFACPQPVIMAQKAIKADAPGELQVLVDNKCAVENVTRFGESQGYTVTAADYAAQITLPPSRLSRFHGGRAVLSAKSAHLPSNLDQCGKV